MDSKWKLVTCSSCSGHGLVDGYDAGPQECRRCNGGQLCIRPNGAVFHYPGGPAAGNYGKESYEKAAPLTQ